MIETYKYLNGKKLKYGYTTGSCAAAASKAAAMMLVKQEAYPEVVLKTPKGWELNLEVHDIHINEESVICAIKKDAGDDPDVTHGIKIYAKVSYSNSGFCITGGKGVGQVTKPGLAIEPGRAAINPVPRQMIREAVKSVLGNIDNISVEIFAPMGETIAIKTFNPRLGIKGGISILGTSGIVEPMSEDAIKKSLTIELKMLKEKGYSKVIFTPGNYGRDFLIQEGLDQSCYIKISNYIGYMLDEAYRLGFKKILLVGHCGKFSKVAGGNFNTHSKISDCRREVFAAYAALVGMQSKAISKILSANTTEEIVKYIYDQQKNVVFNKIADEITKRCLLRTYNEIEIGTLMFSSVFGKLGICSRYEKVVGDFCE